MKKFVLIFISGMLLVIFSGCALSINGKKIISFNERESFEWPGGNNSLEKAEVISEPFKENGRLVVANTGGEIVFKSWEEDSVQITALKSVKGGGSQKDLEQLIDKIKIDVDNNNGNISVNVKYITGVWGVNRQTVNLEIAVPKNAEIISGNSTSGDIRASDLKGVKELNLSSVSGRIEIRSSASEKFSAETTSGGIDIEDSKGSMTLQTISGEITLEQAVGGVKCRTTSGRIKADDIEGSMTASTISGSINVSGTYLGSISDFRTTSGGIHVEAERIDDSGEYKFSSISGSVNVTLDEEASFNLNAGSTSGYITNRFDMSRENEAASKKKVNGRVGSGGADINISTVSGGISILN